jgi:hypothetical protein
MPSNTSRMITMTRICPDDLDRGFIFILFEIIC